MERKNQKRKVVRVGITGASGNLGRLLMDELSSLSQKGLIKRRSTRTTKTDDDDHDGAEIEEEEEEEEEEEVEELELCGFCYDVNAEEEEGKEGRGIDLGDREQVRGFLKGKGLQVLIHLAASASPFSSWEELKRNNLDATNNLLEDVANAEERIAALKAVLEKLPQANYRLIRQVLILFHRIGLQAAANKMNAKNLSLIFGNTMLKPRIEPPDLPLKILKQAGVVEFMINNCAAVFETTPDDFRPVNLDGIEVKTKPPVEEVPVEADSTTETH